MNLDAEIFIENDPQLKNAVPTVCDVCRAIRAKLLLPPDDITPVKTKGLRESLDNLVGDLLTVRDLIRLIDKLQGRNTPVACPMPTTDTDDVA